MYFLPLFTRGKSRGSHRAMEYPQASRYLQPVLVAAKFCGTFPQFSFSDLPNCKFYLVYLLCVLLLATNFAAATIPLHYNAYKDIICFSVILYDAVIILYNLSAALMPILLRNTYLKMMKAIDKIEKLMHSINISQTQSPNRHCLFFWLFLTFSVVGYTTLLVCLLVEWSLASAIGGMLWYSSYAISLVHVLSLLFVLKSKIVSVNWHLEYLNNKVPVYLLPPDDGIFLEKKIHGEHVEGKFVNYCADVRRVTANKIKTFNRIHFLLYLSCNLLSKYFALPMFLCVLYTALCGVITALLVFDPYSLTTPLKYTLLIPTVYNYLLVFLVANTFYKIQSEVGCF